MAVDKLSVCWDSFHKNMSSGMSSLLENEDLVDVTLAIEGRYLKAHKMVLSVCSPYFKELFRSNPCKHPIVFMKDVTFDAMTDLLQFVYKGEVQVNEKNFSEFIKTAKSLQIKGLTGYGNDTVTESQCEQINKTKSQYLMSEKDLPIPSSKKLRLNEPVDEEMVKSEPISTFSEEQILFKTEPVEESSASVDDDSNENFPDDPLRNCTNVDENEDLGIIDDDDDYDDDNDEAKVSTSDGIMKGDNMEDAIPSDIDEGTSLLIPERSRKHYNKFFVRFEEWCKEKNFKTINENVLLTYFKEKSINCKPSTLTAFYSILRTMLSIKHNIDISRYKELTSFLKRNSEGYKVKKSEVFSREHFERFLREASDDKFLMMKVAMIIGIAGACRREELTYLLVENVIDEGDVIRVQLPEDRRNGISKEFIITAGNIQNVNLVEIIRKYMKLRPLITDHHRFFIFYGHGQCTKQPVGVNKFGSMPKSIARFLGLPNSEQYTGHCFRRTAATLKLVQCIKKKSLMYCSL